MVVGRLAGDADDGSDRPAMILTSTMSARAVPAKNLKQVDLQQVVEALEEGHLPVLVDHGRTES